MTQNKWGDTYESGELNPTIAQLSRKHCYCWIPVLISDNSLHMDKFPVRLKPNSRGISAVNSSTDPEGSRCKANPFISELTLQKNQSKLMHQQNWRKSCHPNFADLFFWEEQLKLNHCYWTLSVLQWEIYKYVITNPLRGIKQGPARELFTRRAEKFACKLFLSPTLTLLYVFTDINKPNPNKIGTSRCESEYENHSIIKVGEDQ